jgi:hypothetical protein
LLQDGIQTGLQLIFMTHQPTFQIILRAVAAAAGQPHSPRGQEGLQQLRVDPMMGFWPSSTE